MTLKTSAGKTVDSLKQSVKKIDNRELASSGFWIGHVLMILATIAGVYLAAQAGLAQAVRFDQFNDMENNFYLRRSLLDEVNDNIKLLREYERQYLSKGVSDVTLKLNHPQISTYVWETMKFSQSTLETPSFFLTEIRRFYSNSKDLIDKAESGQLGAGFAAGRMRDVLDQMENKVIPKLQANCDELERRVKEFKTGLSDI